MTQDKPPPRKTAAEVLKEALATKKSGSAGLGASKLRPDMGKGNGASKDAERLKGKSRKVH